MTKIYCWVNSGKETDWQVVIAMDENGFDAGNHVSSSVNWAKHDIGYSNPNHYRHEYYRKAYPDGYELVWVDNPREHPGLMEAHAKTQALPDDAKGPGEPPTFSVKVEVSD